MDMAEMMRAMAGGKGPDGSEIGSAEMRSMQQVFETMSSADPEMKKQMEGYWKMLDQMAQSTPEEYDRFIAEQK